MTPNLKLTRAATKKVEHDAYYQGAQGVPAENGVKEIESYNNKSKADVQKRSSQRLKPLEAQYEHYSKIAPEVEAKWAELKERHGENPPHLAAPLFYLTGGLLSMIAEANLLAPSLDAIGVANPIEQKLMAFAIGFFAATFFHFAWQTFQENRFSTSRILISRLAGLGATVGMVYLGILRGRQTAFAASLNGNPVGQFMQDFPIITTVFFVFLTLGFPLAAAFALTFSLKDIREWKEYSDAKRQAIVVPKMLIAKKKQIEAERESLDHELKRIDEQNKEWRHAYLVHHERGVKNGAKQTPQWLVWFKAVTAALLTLFLIGITGLIVTSPFWLLAPVLVFLGAYKFFRHQRIHPTPEQFFDVQNVRFHAEADDPSPIHSSKGELE